VSTLSEVLATVPLFSLLDAQQRAALAERLDEVRMPSGTALFHAGDPGGSMFVVLEGEVEVFFKNATGERFVLQRADGGDFFGEISLLDGGARTASALVTSPLRALVIGRDDLTEFLNTCPTAAIDLMSAMGKRMRETAHLLRGAASRNVNVESEDKRGTVQKAADWVSDFSGSLSFLFIHLAVFAVWIVLNVQPLAATRFGGWDAYPFGLLTMSVSLEAIILSVFVLLSQSRQVARDRVRNDIEYEINYKAELEIGHLHEKVDRLYEQLVRRLANIERATGAPPLPASEGADSA
jgi:CRP/FNR family cyclic AMP-dependent transcriptional regulator